MAGVPAIITGFSIDGEAQKLSQYFPSPNIPPNSTVSANVVFRNLAAPLIRTFGFTGVDATGQNWSRQVSVNYFPFPEANYFGLSATPLTAVQNTAADPSCQWAVQLNLDDLGGFGINTLTSLSVGHVELYQPDCIHLRHDAPGCLGRLARYALFRGDHAPGERIDQSWAQQWKLLSIWSYRSPGLPAESRQDLGLPGERQPGWPPTRAIRRRAHVGSESVRQDAAMDGFDLSRQPDDLLAERLAALRGWVGSDRS